MKEEGMPAPLSGASAALNRKCVSCASTYEEAVTDAMDNFDNCREECAQQLADDLRACAGPDADQCRADGMTRYRNCIQRCIDIRDAELAVADATFHRDVLRSIP
jgi:hypothetical protein